MGTSEPIGADQRSAAGRLVAQYRLRLLLIFGSVVTGRARPDSDLDIGILAGRQLSPQDWGEIGTRLSTLFPARTVDLADLDRADPLFLAKVSDSAVLLGGTARALAEFRIYAFRRYQDHKRYLALEPAYLARFLEQRRT
jgi:predicted nucleotidyltransferase